LQVTVERWQTHVVRARVHAACWDVALAALVVAM
jgi:hypothetical protein